MFLVSRGWFDGGRGDRRGGRDADGSQVGFKYGADGTGKDGQVFEDVLHGGGYGRVALGCPHTGIVVYGIGYGYGDVFHGLGVGRRREFCGL